MQHANAQLLIRKYVSVRSLLLHESIIVELQSDKLKSVLLGHYVMTSCLCSPALWGWISGLNKWGGQHVSAERCVPSALNAGVGASVVPIMLKGQPDEERAPWRLRAARLWGKFQAEQETLENFQSRTRYLGWAELKVPPEWKKLYQKYQKPQCRNLSRSL